MTNFSYDELSDSLFVSTKGSNEKVEGSAEIGNVIFDFTKEGKLVSVEMREISKYLDFAGIGSSILNKLTNATLLIQKKGDAFIAWIVLKTPAIEKKVPLAMVPTRRPILV